MGKGFDLISVWSKTSCLVCLSCETLISDLHHTDLAAAAAIPQSIPPKPRKVCTLFLF